MIPQFLILGLGLGLLWAGAELLIRNSSKLAQALGVSPIIIGLTVVSIGTSLPEFVVSLTAAIQDTMGISIGNIVGSNVANIGLILGIGAIITSLEVKKSWVFKEVPAMIFFTVVFIFFAYTGHEISRWEGIILFLFLIGFLIYISKHSMNEMREYQELQDSQRDSSGKPPTSKKLLQFAMAVAGIVLLIIGSNATVSSGSNIARSLGVRDTVIGLSLIAVGTSLPELATTIVGVLKKETDIVVGNVIGSNIFNLLFIGGVVPIIRPLPVESSLFSIEFPFLLCLSLLVWPIMRLRWNVHRYEGILLLAAYLAFIILIFRS